MLDETDKVQIEKIPRKILIKLIAINAAVLVVVIGAAIFITSYAQDNVSEDFGNPETHLVTQRSSLAVGVQYEMTENFLAMESYKADADKTVIRVYSDLSCSYCRDFAQEIDPLVRDALKSEANVRFEFVNVNYLGARNTNNWSDNAGQMLALIADNRPTKYLDVAQALYDNQPTADTQDKDINEEAILKITSTVVDLTYLEKQMFETKLYSNWLNNSVTPFAATNKVKSVPTVTMDGNAVEDRGEIIEFLKKTSINSHK